MKLTIRAVLTLAVIALVAFLTRPNPTPGRASRAICRNGILQLEGAKEQWALEKTQTKLTPTARLLSSKPNDIDQPI